MLSLSLSLLFGACEPQKTADRDALPARSDAWADFPKERDLAILFPLQEEAYVPASALLTGGREILPREWVQAVSDAYLDTEVEDAMEWESLYEDWRLVSMRVSPCAPLAHAPSQAPASLCWPIVRLVWQPVVEDVQVTGMYFPVYADDRAIHTLYPVQPRDSYGLRADTQPLDDIQAALKQGYTLEELSAEGLAELESARDTTVAWLLTRLATLRGPELSAGSWDGLELRPELLQGAGEEERFMAQLMPFLEEFAATRDLRELTSFSLPGGRNPAGDDLWVFLQFFSEGDSIWQQELELISRSNGEVLLNYGLDQSVGQGHEDLEVEEALRADGDSELHDTVVESSTEIEAIAEAVVDPEAVFVPNTTCATCHRLNPLRFDFHSLSHLEERAHSVSPRVEQDVARDMSWTQAWAEGMDLGLLVEDADSTWEPNESPEQALTLTLPVSLSLEIEQGDLDYFRFSVEEGSHQFRIDFSHSRGDLDLYLLDESGEVLDYSNSTEDYELISRSLEAGSYTLLIYGYEAATGDYQLSAS